MHHCECLWKDIYVISELMETDLASILKSPQPLSDEHCQFFTYQVRRCETSKREHFDKSCQYFSCITRNSNMNEFHDMKDTQI